MECFIGVAKVPKPFIRQWLEQACISSWELYAYVFWKPTTPSERWKWAEKQAEGPIYILADDDCLLIPPFDIDKAISLMEIRPEIAILAARPYDRIENFTFDKDDFCEYNSVGGIRFIRKGILEFPPGFRGDDSEVGNIVYKKGYKCGFIGSLERNHIGRGYSTEWWKEIS